MQTRDAHRTAVVIAGGVPVPHLKELDAAIINGEGAPDSSLLCNDMCG